jgi:AraC-like DNA-binding protein
MSDPPQGCFYLWGDRALYLGLDVPATVHAHHAVQVCIGLSGPVRLRTGPPARWRDYDVAVIPSDQPHVSDYVPGTAIATLWLDPDGAAGRRFPRRGCGAAPIARLAGAKLAGLVPCLLACWRDGEDAGRAASLADAVVAAVAPGGAPSVTIDPRIGRIREALAAAPDRRTSLARVAAGASLSPSRLAHLFRDEMGLPVRRYLLWLRLRDALVELARGTSITEAAHAAGFADGAHFSRTFRRMLGFTPSDALRVSKFVQDAATRA